MTLKKLAGASLMIALGIFALRTGRADEILAQTLGAPGFASDGTLPVMYSASLLSSETVSQNSVEIAIADYSLTSAVLPLTAEPLIGNQCSVIPDLSGVPATSFSNLNLPAALFGEFGECSDAELPPETCLLAAAEDASGETWAMSFTDWNRPNGGYWELVSAALNLPGVRQGIPEMATSFELTGDWRTRL